MTRINASCPPPVFQFSHQQKAHQCHFWDSPYETPPTSNVNNSCSWHQHQEKTVYIVYSVLSRHPNCHFLKPTLWLLKGPTLITSRHMGPGLIFLACSLNNKVFLIQTTTTKKKRGGGGIVLSSPAQRRSPTVPISLKAFCSPLRIPNVDRCRLSIQRLKIPGWEVARGEVLINSSNWLLLHRWRLVYLGNCKGHFTANQLNENLLNPF